MELILKMQKGDCTVCFKCKNEEHLARLLIRFKKQGYKQTK